MNLQIDDDDRSAPHGGKVATATRIVYVQEGEGCPSSEGFVIDLAAHTFACEYTDDCDRPDPAYIAAKPLPCKLPPAEWQRLLVLLGRADIDGWKDEYCDLGVCDGTQWRLSLYEGERETRRIEGDNAWPEGWRVYMSEIIELCGEVIGLPDIYFGGLSLCEEDDDE